MKNILAALLLVALSIVGVVYVAIVIQLSRAEPTCGRLIIAISQETEDKFLMRRVVLCGRDIKWTFENPYSPGDSL